MKSQVTEKHSSRRNQIHGSRANVLLGLKELIEYMTYARIGQVYLNEDPYFSIKGLLITDGVETAPSIDSIRHRTAKELLNEDQSNQPAVLKRSS